jgi:hypothetical protein
MTHNQEAGNTEIGATLEIVVNIAFITWAFLNK